MFLKASKTLILLFIFSVPWADVIELFSGSVPSVLGTCLVPLALLALLIDTDLRKFKIQHALIFCFFIWVNISYFWSLDPQASLQRILTFSQLIFFILIYFQTFRTKADVHKSLSALLYGLYLTSIATIYNWVQGKNFFRTYDERYSSFNADPNDLALSLALGMPIAFYLFNVCKTKKSLIYLSFIPLSLFAVSLTGSRSGLICAIFALIFLLPSWSRLSFPIKAGLIFVLASGSIYALDYIPENELLRYSQIPEQIANLDLTHRVKLWQGGIDLFSDNIFVGIGTGAFRSEVGSVIGFDNVAHNTPLSLLVETGVIGFLLFYSIVLSIILHLRRLDPFSRTFWLFSFMVLALGTFGLTWEYRKIPWLYFAMVISHIAVTNNEKDTRVGSSS